MAIRDNPPTEKMLEAIIERISSTGLIESLYTHKPIIITKPTYDYWVGKHESFKSACGVGRDNYKRAQPGYFQHLARECIEDALLSHRKPKTVKTKTVKTRYVVGKRNELTLEFTEESETTTEVWHKCPTRILEMVMPTIPQTTIDILATQMANEGILPQKKAEAIMAIADQAQTTIRGVLSGSSETEE